jgi:hypothetical protein
MDRRRGRNSKENQGEISKDIKETRDRRKEEGGRRKIKEIKERE